MNLHQHLANLARIGRLREFTAQANPDLEIPNILAKLDRHPTIFQRVKGSAMPLAGNLCGTRDVVALGLGCSAGELLHRLVLSQRQPAEPPIQEKPPCMECELPPDFRLLPILRHMPEDGGPYITSAVCVVRHPQYGLNAAFHRLMILGKNRATIRIVEDRHTDHAVKATRGDTPIAICIGAPIQAQVAAAMSPPEDVFEMNLAHALAETPLARCELGDLLVPAESEIVIEGYVTKETDREGPFLDLTQTRDFVRQQPVVRIERIHHRRDAIYQALLPGLSDHRILMGMPREADIFLAVSEVCECLDVCVTPGGCSWLHAVVKIRKQKASDGQGAIEAAFAAHRSLKHCVVVDEDVNCHDPSQVEWAIATRFQAAKDLFVFSDRPSSSLDPSAEHPPGRKAIGSKMGLDATIKGKDKSPFLRVEYANVDDEAIKRLE